MISKAKTLASLGRSPRSERDRGFPSSASSANDSAASRRRARTLATALAVSALTLVLAVALAQAAKGVVDFFGGTGTAEGQFSASNLGPGGVALSQAGNDTTGGGGASAGDLYVADRGNHRVQQFDASGTFIRTFGADVGGAGVDVCTSSCAAGTATADAGGLNVPQGVAVDQAEGLLYVTDQTNRRVDVFSAAGDFQGAFGWGVDTGASAFEFCTTASTCQAPAASGGEAGQFGTSIGYPAVAPSGAIYVADRANRRVDLFTPTIAAGVLTAVSFTKAFGWGVDTGAAAFETCTTASTCQPGLSGTGFGQFAFNQPAALAIDSAGRSYAVDSDRVQKFDSSESPVAIFASAELSSSPSPVDLAVDRSDDHVFVDKPCDPTACPAGSLPPPFSTSEHRVLEFDAGGTLLDTHGAGAGLTSLNGIALAQASGNLYLSSRLAPNLGVFILATPVPPIATIDPVTAIGADTATLNGTVNPTGFTTAYHFEYSTDGANWTKVPATDATLPFIDNAAHAVSESATGLTGSQLYRVRLVATKPFAAGAHTSPETTFTTDPAPPLVANPTASEITDKRAKLQGEINPQNQPTTYRFEYTDDADFQDNGFDNAQAIPVPDAELTPGGESAAVAELATGLAPQTTYHFRLLAANPSGPTEGPEATFTTYAAPQDFGPCPNDDFRTAPSAALPDCRAYEQVTPTQKNGVSILDGEFDRMEAALDGDSFMYYSAIPLPSGRGPRHLATRGGGGWTSQQAHPDASLQTSWTADLSAVMYRFNVAGAGNEFRLHRSSDQGIETLISAPPGGTARFAGASANDSRIFFESTAALEPGAVSGKPNLYLFDRDTQTRSLAGVLPAGEGGTGPPGGAFAGPYDWWGSNGAPTTATGGATVDYQTKDRHAISEDGAGVYFTAGATGQLYLRRGLAGPSPDTVRVSAPQRAVPDPNGAKPAAFMAATPAGERAFFTSCEKLTDDSTAVSTAASTCLTTSQGQDLYRYDDATGDLTDLTVDTGGGPLGADVKGVLGTSSNGERLYFTANGVLADNTGADGTTATPGSCQQGSGGGYTFGGLCNLYFADGSSTTFVAQLDASGGVSRTDAANWTPAFRGAFGADETTTGFVSATGDALVFRSQRRLTAYDNTAACAFVAPCPEFYRYDADADRIDCLSCSPVGAPPLAPPKLWSLNMLGGQAGFPYRERNLSSDGKRFFFESPDKLVPEDTNGDGGCPTVAFNSTAAIVPSCQDVYQWEAEGSGSCEAATVSGGCLYLLSTGSGENPSFLADAAADGGDVFFYTFEQLVPQDDDQLADLYDARSGGGLTVQHATPPQPCSGDACQGDPTPAPGQPNSGSSTFTGPGNAGTDRTPPTATKNKKKCKKKRSKRARRRCKRRTKRARAADPTAGAAR